MASGEGDSLIPPMPALSCRADVALRGIYEISKVLSVPGRLDDVLAQVLALLASFVDMRRATIALIGEARRSEAGRRPWRIRQGFRGAPLPERAVGRVVTSKAPLIVDNIENDPDFAGWPVDPGGKDKGQALIAAPILDRGEAIGVLAIDRPSDGGHRAAMDSDARFLGMIANMIGQTLHLYDVVSRDRERLMEDQRRLEKESPRRAGNERRTGVDRHRRREPRDPRGVQPDQCRGPDPYHRAAARRIRHRQGIVRARHP